MGVKNTFHFICGFYLIPANVKINLRFAFDFYNLALQLPLSFGALKIEKEHITFDLLNRLKNGDMLAFDKVYQLYSHKLFSFVFRILKNEDEAEDIVQEVFVKIWESRERLGDFKLLNSYIFTIAYNQSIDLIRKRIHNSKYLEHLKNASILQESVSIITDVEFNELSNQVDGLIQNLPERQKQVYLLHREEGLTYPEIAERLGISKNTVENHMVKALKYLRENMDNSMMVNLLFICLFL